MILLSLILIFFTASAEVVSSGHGSAGYITAQVDREPPLPYAMENVEGRELNLKKDISTANCPRGNFDINRGTDGITVLAYDRLENATFFGESFHFYISNKQHTHETLNLIRGVGEVSCSVKTESRFAPNNVLLYAVNTSAEECSDGKRTHKKETLSFHQLFNNHVKVVYKKEITDLNTNHKSTETYCEYTSETL